MVNYLHFNGLNGTTGKYITPAMDVEQFWQFIQKHGDLDLKPLENLHNRSKKRGLSHDDGQPNDLANLGWAAIFPTEQDPAIYQALKPLLAHRQAMAGEKNPRHYREFRGQTGYHHTQSKHDFLSQHRIETTGFIKADKLPYYLLLVGSPQEIPFRFQYELDVDYAVGRIHFDTIEEYERYAASVVAAESIAKPPEIAFFGVSNPNDQATAYSTQYLVKPLAKYTTQNYPQWQVKEILKESATKAALSRLLKADTPPALLFTASHGIEFNNEDSRKRKHQGALVCQDWPGPQTGEIIADYYFSADDITAEMNFAGMVAFHFACFSAGTPDTDDFASLTAMAPMEVAPAAFLSRLPQRMLSHANGAALAVVGHVERAWDHSFFNGDYTELNAFEKFLHRMLKGEPIGFALEKFNERYATIATELLHMLDDGKRGKEVDKEKAALTWIKNNDARNTIILGDPAVHLNTNI